MSQQEWESLCFQDLNVPPPVATQWWAILFSYLQPSESRPYHNLNHIADLLNKLASSPFPNSIPIKLAIWFHDVIYDPVVGNNEERSAEMFYQFAHDIQLDKEIVFDVGNWIVETKRHTTSTYTSSKRQAEFLLFLDLDMSILSSAKDQYEAYTRAIRREYIHIPDREFVLGRLHFLRPLALEPHVLFRTELFHRNGALEQATRNIQEEIVVLTVLLKQFG